MPPSSLGELGYFSLGSGAGLRNVYSQGDWTQGPPSLTYYVPTGDLRDRAGGPLGGQGVTGIWLGRTIAMDPR